jgi:AcrR family transcriptional regulator
MPTSPRKTARVRPGRLSAAQTEELPDRLMDAAFDVFIERGFGDATMDDIARRAGASTKTLYSRFANKGEILQAVVARNIEQTVISRVAAFNMTPETSEPREFLFKVGLQIAVATHDRSASMQRVSIAEAHRFPVLRKNYRYVIGLAIDGIANALRIWRDKGLLKLTHDAHVVATIFFSAMTDQPRIRAIIDDPMSRNEIEVHVATAVDLLLAGMQSDLKTAPKTAKK